MKNANNQYSLFTSTGQQLVSGTQASQLSFNNVGTLSATSLWSANPSQDGAGTITLTSPGGHPDRSDCRRAPSSRARSAPICRCATPSCRRRRTSSTNWPIKCRRRCRTRPRRARRRSPAARPDSASTSAACRPAIRCSSPIPIPAMSSTRSRSWRWAPAAALPLQTSPSNPNNQIIGVNFAGGMAAVVTQLNAAFGTNLQFSNPSGTVLQAVNASATTNVVNALSATSTVTSLTSGSPQLPLFLDGTTPITGALTAAGSQTTGLAGRITVNRRGRRRAGKPRRLCGRHRRGRSDAAELLAQPADRRHADLCADHRHRQRAAAVQRHARRLT